MAEIGAECKKGLRGKAVILIALLVLACGIASAQEDIEQVVYKRNGATEFSESDHFTRIISFLKQTKQMLSKPVWPEMEFDWRIVVGTVIGFFGAALGSVGGVGGGGIFVPMLTLIIGFDPKSSTAISKCMIAGAALATVYYNIKLRHPSLDLPMIDYDLALLFQPMLILGISIGVFFNVIFAEWMVTVLLIVLFIATATKAFFKGVETWKKETIMKKEAARRFGSDYNGSEEAPYKPLPTGPANETRVNLNGQNPSEVSIINNVRWKKLGVLFAVWLVIISLHVSRDFMAVCSVEFWIVTLLQIPVTVGVAGYQSVCLYKGWSVIESKGVPGINWTVYQLILCCICAMLAGVVGGLLGLGGGFILGPLFLELGVPPQVSTATTTLVLAFSASMSVIQYYLLGRFPPVYAFYFVVVATFAALVGQHLVRKIVGLLGRASLIIFILAFTIFVSAISLGWVGIANIIGNVDDEYYMWFYNFCEYKP
ncbi:Sulfite exporter TauE/SafE family protein [Perilla frutescens var. hirtella]|uniref:Sulfite exporter TauE/SafE family protein n=1 Tax=Perilla frutescens var. hirtella TaxID=608512 RepID=A0AAD4ISZ9_PERFH|nr:Sulfite exporter TauE/SafE family protein [Perilla frutescens var. frutescens]KAH6820967.1 Sulfite exporter TauE/SafE family protein [Perilla frutescens var. hirtella]